jgi:hypothetical protein
MFFSRKGSRWVERTPPPASHDFVVGDFTTDGNYHDLDLSTIVPANAKEVIISVEVRDDLAQQAVVIKKKGYMSDTTSPSIKTQVANVSIADFFRVPIGSDGIVEYLISNTTWTSISVDVVKWLI